MRRDMQLGDIFDQMFRNVGMWREDMLGDYPVDIHEEDGEIQVDAELPGFKPDEVDVRLENGRLYINAERDTGTKKGTAHVNERRFTRVNRTFTLPAKVDEEKVNANMENGVLHLTMPKKENEQSRRIEVR
jgi:HSP20 family protein